MVSLLGSITNEGVQNVVFQLGKCINNTNPTKITIKKTSISVTPTSTLECGLWMYSVWLSNTSVEIHEFTSIILQVYYIYTNPNPNPILY